MTFILSLLIACGGTHAAAKVIECAGLLETERTRLAAGLKHALDTDEETARDPVFRRLDQDLFAWTEAELSRVSAGKRETVLTLLENAVLGTPFKQKRLAKHEWLGDAHGQVYVDDGQVILVLDAFETRSEASRFTLRHELTHLIRFAEDGPIEETAARASRLTLDRPYGLLREESYAYREDYRYLRRNYGPEDIPRLEARQHGIEGLLDVAQARGFLRRYADGGAELNFARVRAAVSQVVLFRILTIEADVRMLRRVREAYQVTEMEWVKARLGESRVDQLQLDRQAGRRRRR